MSLATIAWVGPVAACSSDVPVGEDGQRDQDEEGVAVVAWSALGDIAYVLPDELPDGWALGHATERRGRPPEEWGAHIEIFATAGRDRFLLVSAATAPAGSDDDGAPGAVEPFDPEGYGYVLAYTIGTFPEGLEAAGTGWQENGLDLAVSELGPAPDRDLVLEVAADLQGADDLDFDLPAVPEGFTRVAASSAFPDDVTDYTVVWRPEELVGRERADSTGAPDGGPTLVVNVGCRFYAQPAVAAGAPTDPADAEVTQDGDQIQIDFLLDGSAITVSGRDVTEAELVAFARSLRTLDRDDWEERTGDRLLVQEPER